MDRLEHEQSVLDLLKSLVGLEPLKKLFWSELNYDRVNQPLSRRTWNQTAATALTEDPVLFAGGGQNNDFHVVYSRLPQDRLLLGQERPVVTQLLKEHPYGLFIFSNQAQDRWHFINVKYDTETEKRRLFRRISVGPEERLRTAAERLSLIDLESISPELSGLSPLAIQYRHDEAFDVEAVTKQFFEEYKAVFRILENDLKSQANDHTWAHDYSLQFLNRCMFIYFIQRKGWLGNDRDFLLSFWKSYQRSDQGKDSFVDNWLKVLFFEAFNNKFHLGHSYFPAQIKDSLSLAPYLNGGLFTENRLDQNQKAIISDQRFEQILKFLERYNFTIAEDSPLDKEVAVDPEMLGKVYESLVNVSEEIDQQGEAGIFYTPRTEIDLMCRLSLVDHLTNHLGEAKKELFYQLVFALEPDEKTDADKAVAAAGLWPALNERLHDITLLDPACGSGSFLVGMLNILDDIQERANRQLGVNEDSFTRKRRIIGQSLYGVDVMEWACHVAELRLWLALIINAEFTWEELHVRREPLLPHFTFKIRCGDSLVQEVGGINLGYSRHHSPIRSRTAGALISNLKRQKMKFYNCESDCQFKSAEGLRNEEKRVFVEILKARSQEIQGEIITLRRKIEGPSERRIRLDGTIEEHPHQMDLNAAALQRQIEDLNLEHEQVKQWASAIATATQVPFVWNVAFVEAFSEGRTGFDIVMGNPPYVRQETIAAPVVQGIQVTTDKKEYKAKLALAVYRAFPHFFGYKVRDNSIAHKIDAKSDLYSYFYFRGLSLLNDKGSFCFITSNSWLDVGYGADLQEFLLKHSHVKLVLDNQVKRTFANADVNSIIVLFSAPDDRRDSGLDKMARFVMFRCPFEHILSPVIFDEIEEANERKATKEYRVFPIQQGKLLEDGCEIPEDVGAGLKPAPTKTVGPLIKTARYIGNKWGGKYLRAPDIYWTILEKGKGKLVRLGDIAEVRRGFTTGANEFFYLNEERTREWGIEEEYLKPVIKSPRDLYRIRIVEGGVWLFWCQNDRKALRSTNALKYITYGESKGYHQVPTCKTRNNWYALRGPQSPVLLWPSAFFERHIVFECPKSFVADKVFYTISGDIPSSVRAYLNSSFVSLFVEVEGYQLNHGGIFVTTDWLSNLPVLKASHKYIEDLYETITKRDILLCADEHKKEDRQALDRLVLSELLGTANQNIIESLYEAIEAKVMDRIHKARREITKKGRTTGM